MATPKAGIDEPTAEALLNMAREYHLAATSLLPLHPRVNAPLYFLFAHTIELVLKAYLRSCGLSTPRGQKGHALQSLLDQCEGNGLKIGDQWHDVIQLLESETKWHGFRYFAFKSTVRPDINYLREVVDDLVLVVEADVNKKPATVSNSAVVKFIVGKTKDS